MAGFKKSGAETQPLFCSQQIYNKMKQLCKIFSSESYAVVEKNVNRFLDELPPMTGANVCLSTSSYNYMGKGLYGVNGVTIYTAIITYAIGEIPVEHLPY